VLILHRDDIIEHLAEVTIAPLTTTIRNIPSEVVLSSVQDGVPRDSAVNLDHIQTVPKSIGNLIKTSSWLQMESVNHALRFALGVA
jgi:mRNA interferase MazF